MKLETLKYLKKPYDNSTVKPLTEEELEFMIAHYTLKELKIPDRRFKKNRAILEVSLHKKLSPKQNFRLRQAYDRHFKGKEDRFKK